MSTIAQRFVGAALAAASVLVANGMAQHTQPGGNPNITVTGAKKQWQFLTMTLNTSVTADEDDFAAPLHPFFDYRLTVTFTHSASGVEHVIPGFFAADGNAANSSVDAGNKWRVMFTPDRTGYWSWTVSFRKGNSGQNIAVNPDIAGSPADPGLDGEFGGFYVLAPPPSALGFFAKGALQWVGGHYLRFAQTGEYFLKSGAGGPENFLAYVDFDNTSWGGTGTRNCLAPSNLHSYWPHDDAHGNDFDSNDPIDAAGTWLGGGTEDKGENILGAVNYLASQGVNSYYLITYTGDSGDGNDVWPWIAVGQKSRYDVSKLAQWEKVFTHMDHRGIQLQVFFEELENDHQLGLSLTDLRKLYYREMVARFAHHHAVVWVLGEETGHSSAALQDFAAYIRDLDPYRHPITIHNIVGQLESQYSALYGDEDFDVSAFYTGDRFYYTSTKNLRTGSAGAGRPWAIFGDEQFTSASPGDLDVNRKQGLWGNLMAGGSGVAWYPGTAPCDYHDLLSEDFRKFVLHWQDTLFALNFFRTYLPFTEMVPNNALVDDPPCDPPTCQPENFVFAKVGEVYAVYRSTGTTTNLDLGPTNTSVFTVQWYNPRDGGTLQIGSVSSISGTGFQSIGTPPPPANGTDWVALVKKFP